MKKILFVISLTFINFFIYSQARSYQSSLMEDVNNNGLIDRITITLNGNLAASFTDNFPTEWTLTNPPTGAAITQVTGVIGTNIVTVTITGTTEYDTAVGALRISYDGTGAASGLVNAFFNRTPDDGARPRILSAVYQDSDNNGQVDRVLITFTEN
ncbi:MAG: hypothetical protein JXB50_01535, partial [Spirochaetes bacterium]|nr:hypothetical protein [Spirochaetota bacterium]